LVGSCWWGALRWCKGVKRVHNEELVLKIGFKHGSARLYNLGINPCYVQREGDNTSGEGVGLRGATRGKPIGV
jgi:hypothetical protein